MTSTDAVAGPTLVEPAFTLRGGAGSSLSWSTSRVAAPRGGPGVDAEFPTSWSPTARAVAFEQYFRRSHGELSLRQVIDRIGGALRTGFAAGGYGSEETAELLREELKYLLASQHAAFNSPVWFNLGVPGVAARSSACFILGVEDSLPAQLDWCRTEAMIFELGSGSGANLSRIRSSTEPFGDGHTASGPLPFMRVTNAIAGAIRSGGRLRRSSRMNVLDVDHPDILEFVRCKADEEDAARALGLRTVERHYDNANNSVRVGQAFLQAVEDDAPWHLTARTSGEPVVQVGARDLLRTIADAAWRCGDPGLQFADTIAGWHTSPRGGDIRASNPCAEFLFLDDSACNLASLNLGRFVGPDGAFEVERFVHAINVMVVSQDVLVGISDYPTTAIQDVSHRYRPIGLGISNLGGVLMRLGLPYDSDDGRAWAGAVTALLTSHAYLASTAIARRLGPFAEYSANLEAVQRVLRQHRDAARDLLGSSAMRSPEIRRLSEAAVRAWNSAVAAAEQWGVRNSQVTLVAPAGTISLVMDCDTTGVEPEYSLLRTKHLAGGGVLELANSGTISLLSMLGYDRAATSAIVRHISEHGSTVGCSELGDEHQAIFATAVGDNPIAPAAHVQMVAAIQPFLSGGVSKTVNLPTSAGPEDIEAIYRQAGATGVKCLSVYRDQSKVTQPLVAAERSPSLCGCGTESLRQAGTCLVCPDCGASSGCG